MRNSLKESPTSIKLMIYIVIGIKTIQGTTYIEEAPWKYGLDFEQAESGRKVAEGGVILILELLVITKPADIMSSGHNIKGGSNGHFNHVDPTRGQRFFSHNQRTQGRDLGVMDDITHTHTKLCDEFS
jgi:hypothetical protein